MSTDELLNLLLLHLYNQNTLNTAFGKGDLSPDTRQALIEEMKLRKIIY